MSKNLVGPGAPRSGGYQPIKTDRPPCKPPNQGSGGSKPGDRVRELAHAVAASAQTFRDYERQHLAKTPPDTVKAERNAAMALMCERALGNAGNDAAALRLIHQVASHVAMERAIGWGPDSESTLLILRLRNHIADIPDDDVSPWLPISTAPRDGTKVDLWMNGKRWTDFGWNGRWERGEGHPVVTRALLGDPSHWLPITEPAL